MEKKILLTEEEFKVYEAALKQVKDNLVENGLTVMVFYNGPQLLQTRCYTHDEAVKKLGEELDIYKNIFDSLPERWKRKIGWNWNKGLQFK